MRRFPKRRKQTIVLTFACLAPQTLEDNGAGRVLVVDGGGSLRCALLGDNIAEMAYKNGWSVSFSTHEHYLSTRMMDELIGAFR
jgi:hypothetical protein